MASGLGVGGDVEQALENVGVPSYVLDETGIVRWINPSAERLLGDIRGRHYYTSVVAPEESGRAPRDLLPEGARQQSGHGGESGLDVDDRSTCVGGAVETVRNHIRRIFQALGVHSRLEAVAAARNL